MDRKLQEKAPGAVPEVNQSISLCPKARETRMFFTGISLNFLTED